VTNSAGKQHSRLWFFFFAHRSPPRRTSATRDVPFVPRAPRVVLLPLAPFNYAGPILRSSSVASPRFLSCNVLTVSTKEIKAIGNKIDALVGFKLKRGAIAHCAILVLLSSSIIERYRLFHVPSHPATFFVRASSRVFQAKITTRGLKSWLKSRAVQRRRTVTQLVRALVQAAMVGSYIPAERQLNKPWTKRPGSQVRPKLRVRVYLPPSCPHLHTQDADIHTHMPAMYRGVDASEDSGTRQGIPRYTQRYSKPLS